MPTPELKLPIPCPRCRRTLKRRMRDTPPGTVVKCVCGATIKVGGDDVRKVQRAMDDLFKQLGKLGKRR